MSDQHENVGGAKASNPALDAAVAEATAKAGAAAVSASEAGQRITEHDARLAEIERFLGIGVEGASLASVVSGIVGEAVPQAAPLAAQVTHYGNLLSRVLMGLESAFGGKVDVPHPSEVHVVPQSPQTMPMQFIARPGRD